MRVFADAKRYRDLMSLGRNIAANYLGQVYTSLIAILTVPLLVEYMGIEAYGLVGFYAMLQGWFVLLDMGLTTAISREAGRYRGGGTDGLALRRLLRALEGLFLTLGAVAMLAMLVGANAIATHWLKIEALDAKQVQHVLSIIALIVVLRWVCGLYRGIITGFEQQVWLSAFTSVVATIRFVFVLPYLIFVGATPMHFFGYQLAIAVVELFILVTKTYRIMPAIVPPVRILWQWEPLHNVMQFALSAAFTSAVWVLVTQADKLMLSGMIPLSEYAVYTMGVLVAGGITILTSPVVAAVTPRMVKLDAEGDEIGLLKLYRECTQLVGVVIIPFVLVFALFPVQVITAWTGQVGIVTRAAPILSLYAIGNGILAFAGLSYMLQVARGNLTLHVAGNVIFVLLFLPILYFAVTRFGMLGAGYAWIITNLFPFVVWLPIVHRKFLKGVHPRWLAEDIFAVALLPAFVAGMAWYFLSWSHDRWQILGSLVMLYALIAASAAASSSYFRARLVPYIPVRSL
jgi:O-antigen/teichoic acid export membrane protein